ncbi:hypothetical protein R1flu_015809 [Riccia fluitans]|uniref:Uncharacterized protein n=1 Tax=Riccia fluitans TaxID=41844 RepID=A0ABD1YK73_9MARC
MAGDDPRSKPKYGVEEPKDREVQAEFHDEWRERERKSLEYLEEITSNPRLHQERLLQQILEKNANSHYLQQFGMNGATDVQTFRKLLPVCDYEDIRPLIQRIADGDKSQLLSGDPVVELIVSTGTTGGECKLLPITEEDRSTRILMSGLNMPILNKNLPGLEKGKCLYFYFLQPGSKSEGGLMRRGAFPSLIHSQVERSVKNLADPSFRRTSPDALIYCSNYEESTYCHLICGLLQLEEVLRIMGTFSSTLLRTVRNLEEWWPEICEDLATGTLSTRRVQSDFVRGVVQPYLRADPELADLVRRECSKKSKKGLLKRLWPNCKILDTICTGTMAAYTPILSHYGDDIPLICSSMYNASEGFFGQNMDSMAPPDRIYYTLIPTIAYYEFIPIPVEGEGEQNNQEILDLTNVEEGKDYEILITTVSGLCRYRMGDVLKVVGFYNAAPKFQFVRRTSVVLSVDCEKIDEKELHLGVTKAAKLVEENVGSMLEDYTSRVDLSTSPPHYVIFMEFRNEEHIVESIPAEVLEKCCALLESTFDANAFYKSFKANSFIGPLELQIVKEGTFQRVAEVSFSRGASPTQYKTPRGLGPQHSPHLEVLKYGLIHRHIHQSSTFATPIEVQLG